MTIMNITIRSSTSNGRTQRIWDCSMCTEEGHALGREMITLGMWCDSFNDDDDDDGLSIKVDIIIITFQPE